MFRLRTTTRKTQRKEGKRRRNDDDDDEIDDAVIKVATRAFLLLLFSLVFFSLSLSRGLLFPEVVMYTRGQNKTKNNGIWGEEQIGFKSDRVEARSFFFLKFGGEAKHKTEKEVNAKRTTFCHISSKKHHPQTTIMLRRSAVTFAERALASSSRTRTSKLATTAQKRGMGAFFFISLLFFPLLFLLVRELKGNRSFDFGFLPSVRTMLCRVTDVVFFLSLFQTRSSLMNLSYYVQLEAKAA